MAYINYQKASEFVDEEAKNWIKGKFETKVVCDCQGSPNNIWVRPLDIEANMDAWTSIEVTAGQDWNRFERSASFNSRTLEENITKALDSKSLAILKASGYRKSVLTYACVAEKEWDINIKDYITHAELFNSNPKSDLAKVAKYCWDKNISADIYLTDEGIEIKHCSLALTETAEFEKKVNSEFGMIKSIFRYPEAEKCIEKATGIMVRVIKNEYSSK